MWRVDKDESSFTDVERFAWNLILPYKHIPIIDPDKIRVEELVSGLTPLFDKLDAAKEELRQGKYRGASRQKIKSSINKALQVLESITAETK